MALLGERKLLEVKLKDYAGLKANARLRSGRVTVGLSRAFEHADRDVVFGLAVELLAGLFRKNYDKSLTKAYRDFVTRESASRLHGVLLGAHGRKRQNVVKGEIYDLNEILGKVAAEYYLVFDGVDFPGVSWSAEKSRRRLGYYEEAFNRIVISRVFDDDRVPQFVLEYVVYHELLHLKHRVLFQRGESLRRTVHPKAFKDDERRFAGFEEANRWIRRNVGRLG